jgi:hypothetical protein
MACLKPTSTKTNQQRQININKDKSTKTNQHQQRQININKSTSTKTNQRSQPNLAKFIDVKFKKTKQQVDRPCPWTFFFVIKEKSKVAPLDFE